MQDKTPLWNHLGSNKLHTREPSDTTGYIYIQKQKKFYNAGQIVMWCTCCLGLPVQHRLSRVWRTCAPIYWLSYF